MCTLAIHMNTQHYRSESSLVDWWKCLQMETVAVLSVSLSWTSSRNRLATSSVCGECGCVEVHVECGYMWRVWVCGCVEVHVWRDESMHKFPNYTFTFLHAPPPTTPTSLPHPPPPHDSPRASSGHAWNQSMVQQLMREGNLRRRLRKASPMGLKARMTWRFSLHRLTKKLKRDSGVCSASLFSACASGRIA